MNSFATDLQRVLCIGGGPAGLYFALLMKARRPAPEVTVVERNRPFDTFGWGVVLCDQTLGNLAAADADTRRADRRRVPSLGRHRGVLQGPPGALGRPRLLRHRPQAPAQHPAGALPRARRRAGVRDRRHGRPGAGRAVRRRPGDRQRRAQQPHPPALRRRLRARRRPARMPLRLARHAPDLRRLHLRVRADRARLVPGPRLPVRRQDLDLHRRDAGGGVAGPRPRQDGAARGDRLLREAVRQVPRRPRADQQRHPPARLGQLDPLSARGLQALDAPRRGRTARACRWC